MPLLIGRPYTMHLYYKVIRDREYYTLLCSNQNKSLKGGDRVSIERPLP